MARKATKTRAHKTASRTEVKETRHEYDVLKRAYHKAGKAAFGKPENSVAKREYKQIKSAYRRVGNKLGRLTGVR